MKEGALPMKNIGQKIVVTLGVVAGALFVLNWARFALMDIHPMVLVIFSPVIVTVIAKFINNGDEDEGKMSQAYKKKFPKNLMAFRVFCVLAGGISLLIAIDETAEISLVLPEAILEIGEYVYLIILALAGVVWVVSEVVRRDFPWGLFRLVERLASVLLICVGVYLATQVVSMIVGPYIVYVGVILLPLVMAGAVVILWKMLWEAWLWLMYRDPEERKKVKIEIVRTEARRAYQELQNQKMWDNARPKDFWGNPYTARDQDGYIKQVRKTSDGTFVDKDGNEYRKAE